MMKQAMNKTTKKEIQLENVSKLHRTLVLEKITTTFPAGKVSVILGTSGSGKTTLLNCILGLDAPDAGVIRISGEEGSSDTAVRVGAVLQSGGLFQHLTVLENLTLAPRLVLKKTAEAAQEKAMTLLKDLDLLEKAYAYPNQISGGELQRASIARALAMEPEVLLMDEPTTALNKKLVIEMVSMLRSLSEDQGMTILISTHDLSFAQQVADALFLLEDGRLEKLSTVPTLGNGYNNEPILLHQKDPQAGTQKRYATRGNKSVNN